MQICPMLSKAQLLYCYLKRLRCGITWVFTTVRHLSLMCTEKACNLSLSSYRKDKPKILHIAFLQLFLYTFHMQNLNLRKINLSWLNAAHLCSQTEQTYISQISLRPYFLRMHTAIASISCFSFSVKYNCLNLGLSETQVMYRYVNKKLPFFFVMPA